MDDSLGREKTTYFANEVRCCCLFTQGGRPWHLWLDAETEHDIDLSQPPGVSGAVLRT